MAQQQQQQAMTEVVKLYGSFIGFYELVMNQKAFKNTAPVLENHLIELLRAIQSGQDAAGIGYLNKILNIFKNDLFSKAVKDYCVRLCEGRKSADQNTINTPLQFIALSQKSEAEITQTYALLKTITTTLYSQYKAQNPSHDFYKFIASQAKNRTDQLAKINEKPRIQKKSDSKAIAEDKPETLNHYQQFLHFYEFVNSRNFDQFTGNAVAAPIRKSKNLANDFIGKLVEDKAETSIARLMLIKQTISPHQQALVKLCSTDNFQPKVTQHQKDLVKAPTQFIKWIATAEKPEVTAFFNTMRTELFGTMAVQYSKPEAELTGEFLSEHFKEESQKIDTQLPEGSKLTSKIIGETAAIAFKPREEFHGDVCDGNQSTSFKVWDDEDLANRFSPSTQKELKELRQKRYDDALSGNIITNRIFVKDDIVTLEELHQTRAHQLAHTINEVVEKRVQDAIDAGTKGFFGINEAQLKKETERQNLIFLIQCFFIYPNYPLMETAKILHISKAAIDENINLLPQAWLNQFLDDKLTNGVALDAIEDALKDLPHLLKSKYQAWKESRNLTSTVNASSMSSSVTTGSAAQTEDGVVKMEDDESPSSPGPRSSS